MIILHRFIIQVITWDVDSLLWDTYFLQIKFFNPQGRIFNLTIEIPPLQPILCKFVTYNESFSSSIKEYHMHDRLDCDQPDNNAYDKDLSLFTLSCLSFPKGCFHGPVADSLEVSF